jgi:hypothetical protein
VRKPTENHAEMYELLLDSKNEKNKKVEEQENKYGCNNNKKIGAHRPRGNDQQLGRILETVNSDNNKSLTRRSHRRVFLFWAWKFLRDRVSPTRFD